MRKHDMAVAAIFGVVAAAPNGYFGYVSFRITYVSKEEPRTYGIGQFTFPQAGDVNADAMS